MPFTGFLLGQSNPDQAEIVAHRTLLDGGVRGFVVGPVGPQTKGIMVNEGDQVFRRVLS